MQDRIRPDVMAGQAVNLFPVLQPQDAIHNAIIFDPHLVGTAVARQLAEPRIFGGNHGR